MKRKFFLILFIISIPLILHANPERANIVANLFRSVENWMGTVYKFGGETKKGIDCSAFVVKVYKEVFSVSMPRTVKEQKNKGKLVDGKLQPGDLLFFNINGKISHVGIYVFDNKFIHAASAGPRTGVIKSSLNEKYYKKRFVFAKRIIKLPEYKNNKKQNIDKYPVRLVIGKTNYNGTVFDVSDVFKEKEPVHIQIVALEKQKYIILIENDNDKTKKLKLKTSGKKNSYTSLTLKKGRYMIKLMTKKEVPITQKQITIK